MVLAYIIFIFCRSNIFMMDLGLVLFNINYAQLVTVLTFTDAIEYGQLKNGQRNEAVVLAVRPMIDKLTGAISNGLVGYIAVAAGMTGAATAADMTAKDIRTFDSMAFYIPMVLAILSIIVFLLKVHLSEEKHAEIVEELKDKLAKGEIKDSDDDQSLVPSQGTELLAPADGELINLQKVVNEDNTVGFPGKGFAIAPSDGRIYAPFDGVIKFTFSTKHAFEIVSDNGLEVIVHVGLGTVNMRGAGFNVHYTDGQKVHAGELLTEFDRDLIRQNGYKDTVVTFMVRPNHVNIDQQITDGSKVHHGDKVMTVNLKE